MAVDLSGTWTVQKENGIRHTITLPGTLEGAGLGDPVTPDTGWISGLYNPFWFEREEYKSKDRDGHHVPFLAQMRTRYSGCAEYSRDLEVPADGDYYLLVELTKWRVTVFLDGEEKGSDESVCAPFSFGPFFLSAGTHELKVLVDNSMQHPYRPDSHGISDSLGACWNGMAGRIALFSAGEWRVMADKRREYAASHPVSVKAVGRNITVNGKAEYMRGTHFGGGFPETVYPPYEREYWDRIFATVKEWGFNFIRCHSFCPPEAAFLAADEAGLYLQIECGMWNRFTSSDSEMYFVLMRETRKILEWFGHHPSFVMLSPTNEPSGRWYEPLKKWVCDARRINEELGYGGRRLFTAQSGWFYDEEPAKITGTDYLYFHRSAFGPINGGMIRNRWGWRGKDYSPSLTGCRLPVISHEMGQWCSYPDLSVAEKFTCAVRGGNYEIFRENARENGVLELNRELTYSSGRNQVRLLKEEFEADLRTPEITGFEYLDLHDYTGQGTAVVGVLDPFFDNKGYTTPGEFGQFNSDTVILARIGSYVYKNTDRLSARVEICNFSGREIMDGRLVWRIVPGFGFDGKEDYEPFSGDGAGDRPFCEGYIDCPAIADGENTFAGSIEADLAGLEQSTGLVLEAELRDPDGKRLAANSWRLTVFADTPECGSAVIVRTAAEAERLLKEGRSVIFIPYMSDMDFECPPLSIRNVFWNAQMGPSWSRPLGISVDTECPLFKYFPTSKSGGWEWENILDISRGLNFPAKYSSIVRAVDDWNRNFPLSLIFEGRVFSGKLLFCGAELSGAFEDRPEAVTLKRALMNYAASDDFEPAQQIEWSDVVKHIRPLFEGSDIIASIGLDGASQDAGDIAAKEANGAGRKENGNFGDLSDINPNIPFRYAPKSLPVTFTVKLKRPVRIRRVYVLPIQSDRDFPGVIREYGIKAGGCEIRGEWKNGFETQWSGELGVIADQLQLTVYSTYSMGEAVRWYEGPDGFYSKKAVEPLAITAASLGIDYEEGDGSSPEANMVRHSDEPFWRQEAARRHIEIDL